MASKFFIIGKIVQMRFNDSEHQGWIAVDPVGQDGVFMFNIPKTLDGCAEALAGTLVKITYTCESERGDAVGIEPMKIDL